MLDRMAVILLLDGNRVTITVAVVLDAWLNG